MPIFHVLMVNVAVVGSMTKWLERNNALRWASAEQCRVNAFEVSKALQMHCRKRRDLRRKTCSRLLLACNRADRVEAMWRQERKALRLHPFR